MPKSHRDELSQQLLVYSAYQAPDASWYGERMSWAIRDMLRMGADPNVRDAFGNTPLIQAIASKNARAIETLIELGADVNAKNTYGDTPLLLAVSTGQTDVAHQLLLAKASAAGANVKGETVALLAAQSTNPAMQALAPFLKGEKPVEELKAAAEKRKWEDALLEAARRGDDATLKQALEKGAAPDTKNKEGTPALALCYSWIGAKMLIDAGADANARDAKGATPLMYLSKLGHAKAVEILLQANADPALTDAAGRSAADYAPGNSTAIADMIEAAAVKRSPDPAAAQAALQKKKITRALFEALRGDDALGALKALKDGADPYASGAEGMNALNYSVAYCQPSATAILLASNVNVNAKDGNGDTALATALKKQRGKRFATLIEFGADPNGKLANGNTYLLEAMSSRSSEFSLSALPALLKQADLNAPGKDGVTPIMLCAKQGGFSDVLKALAEAGADIDARDAEGNTALLIALKDMKAQSVETLVNAGASVTLRNNKGESAADIAKACHDTGLRALILASAEKEKDARIATLEEQVRALSAELTQQGKPAQTDKPKANPAASVDLNMPKL